MFGRERTHVRDSRGRSHIVNRQRGGHNKRCDGHQLPSRHVLRARVTGAQARARQRRRAFRGNPRHRVRWPHYLCGLSH